MSGKGQKKRIVGKKITTLPFYIDNINRSKGKVNKELPVRF